MCARRPACLPSALRGQASTRRCLLASRLSRRCGHPRRGTRCQASRAPRCWRCAAPTASPAASSTSRSRRRGYLRGVAVGSGARMCGWAGGWQPGGSRVLQTASLPPPAQGQKLQCKPAAAMQVYSADEAFVTGTFAGQVSGHLSTPLLLRRRRRPRRGWQRGCEQAAGSIYERVFAAQAAHSLLLLLSDPHSHARPACATHCRYLCGRWMGA